MSNGSARVPAVLGNVISAQEGNSAGTHDVLLRALALFGHGSLRPGQAHVIRDIVSGRPVIAVMSSGPSAAALTEVDLSHLYTHPKLTRKDFESLTS